MTAIRVLLVDDQPAVRAGLRMRLALEPDLMVVGEAADGREAVAMVAELAPDVVVMDVDLRGADGIAVTATLAASGRRPVVVLALRDDPVTRECARAAGAAAFVAKHETDDRLLAAIRRAAAPHHTP
jgi:DNA-binding NarL/FixJ family response regulator